MPYLFSRFSRRRDQVEWTPEADEAFKKLKQYLSSPPILVAARPDEPLLLFVAAMTQVVSAVLIAERDGPHPEATCSCPVEEKQVQEEGELSPKVEGCPVQPSECDLPPSGGDQPPESDLPTPTKKKKPPVQHPVYFISAVLHDGREHYTTIQKLLLGVLIASRKLRHYFEAHRITVVTRYPLERALRNRSATGRIAEWSMELSGFDLHFANTKVIKSAALADFIAE